MFPAILILFSFLMRNWAKRGSAKSSDAPLIRLGAPLSFLNNQQCRRSTSRTQPRAFALAASGREWSTRANAVQWAPPLPAFAATPANWSMRSYAANATPRNVRKRRVAGNTPECAIARTATSGFAIPPSAAVITHVILSSFANASQWVCAWSTAAST